MKKIILALMALAVIVPAVSFAKNTNCHLKHHVCVGGGSDNGGDGITGGVGGTVGGGSFNGE